MAELSAVRNGWRAPLARIPSDFQTSQDWIEKLRLAIYACDAHGRLVWANGRAAELWGREPRAGEDAKEYCISAGLHFVGDETPLATVLRSGNPIRGIQAKVERPDGSSVYGLVDIEPVHDETGIIAGAINCFHEIPDLPLKEQDLRLKATRKCAEEALARRAEEQAALYEFIESLQHSAGLDDVYSKAMSAIDRALGCARASILLYDATKTMKFVAWRGLSERYRRAVEGHSPWTPATKDPAPICIENVEISDLSKDLKATVRAEGITALAFIPIVADGRLLGKFMTYYDRPHVFADDEIKLALAIARQLGFAVERVRSEGFRRCAERAAQQLVAIVESSHDAIISKDLNGVIATWNQGAEHIFGYTAEEVIGRPVTILIPADRLDEEPEILDRIRRGERVDHFETVRRRKDGTLIDISLTISPVRDAQGKIIGASKIARDISERKVAEAKLRNSEHRLQELLAAIPAAIYTTDAQGKITYFNDKAAELAGRTPSLGSDEWCVTWKLYRPDGTPLPHDQCPMAIALKEGRPIRNAEAIAERPDGTRVPFIPHPTPLHDANGTIVGAINMLVDVSERKQSETQQRVLFNELNHRVKNNMQMLQSLLNLASRKTQSVEAQKVLGEASGRVAAMAAAQQVLYGTAEATRFSAQKFLNAVCQTAQQTFARNVTVTCEAEELELSNDTAMPLALILNELLTNAAKHGVNGGGEINIRVGLTRRDDSFYLFVEDDGPGFDLELVRHRSSGLQLVQGLARQLRGRFDVRRAPKTCCSVYFS